MALLDDEKNLYFKTNSVDYTFFFYSVRTFARIW